MPCCYINKRGKNKGNLCGKGKNDYCCLHSNKVIHLNKFPSLVIQHIINSILNEKNNYRDKLSKLLALYGSCKEFHDVIKPYWKILYETLDISKDEESSMKNLTYLQRLRLLLETGCQKCNKPRITKIYWPFPIRVCVDCIKSLTITNYELNKCYNINHYQDDRFFLISIYNRHNGYIEEKVFLKKYVEESLGRSLESLILNDYKRQLSDRLQIDPCELIKFSPSFKSKSKPSLSDVEYEYYRGLARSKIPRNSDEGPMKVYKASIYDIVNKKTYGYWIDKYEDVIKKQKEFEYDRLINYEYDIGRRNYNNILQSIPYFQRVDARHIPELTHVFLKEHNEDIQSVQKKILSGYPILNDFIQKNNFVFEHSNDVINDIIQKEIRFPKREVDEKNIIARYMKLLQYPDIIKSNYFSEIETIDELEKFIADTTKTHVCKECNVELSHREYYIHLFIVHELIESNGLHERRFEMIQIMKLLDNTSYSCVFLKNFISFVFSGKTDVLLRLPNNNNKRYITILCEELNLSWRITQNKNIKFIKITKKEE